MEIVSRHKNNIGVVIGYTLNDNGTTLKLDVYNTVELGRNGKITNAYLLNNGEFRAKDGYTIDTVVDKTEYTSLPVARDKITGVSNSPCMPADYFGREYINICKIIRMYAVSGNIEIDDRPHKANGGANMHLLGLIKSCGIPLKEFIANYLSNIQPYSLEPFQGNKVKNSIWIADAGYKTKLIIKINETDKTKPLVVSFHESNTSKSLVQGHKVYFDKPCAVIVDTAWEVGPYIYSIDFTIQRGFIKFKIHSSANHYNNGVALVRYDDISRKYIDLVTFMVDRLMESYTNKIGEIIPKISEHNIDGNLSFMADGADPLNTLFLMADFYALCRSNMDRLYIMDVAQNFIDELPIIRRQELKNAITNSISIGKVKPNKMLGFIIKSL